MFCPHKNQYLQLVCVMNPRVINKAVDQAMQRLGDPHCGPPAIQRLDSMLPSLYAPHVDITRARRGFERVGLKLLIRQLHSEDSLIQMQALHSVMDQVQISESAMFLIDNHVVFRLIDLMKYRNPVIREKVCITLTHLASYHQARLHIVKRKNFFTDLMWLWLRDKKEIRYAAAYTLRTLSRDLCTCQEIVKVPNIIKQLLKMIINEHVGIVVLHLRTMENLISWNPVEPLLSNSFQVMLSLFDSQNTWVVCAAMDCMAQLLNHEVGRQLADKHDITFRLHPYLNSKQLETIISAVSLMKMTTLTTQSKWRAKECCRELTQKLVHLCHRHNKPLLQISCMQVLINLCDNPDIRNHMKKQWKLSIKNIKIRTHEDWDGTSESTSFGLATGHNYRTMCIEDKETIKNDYGDTSQAVNIHSYLGTVYDTKQRLINAINWKPYA